MNPQHTPAGLYTLSQTFFFDAAHTLKREVEAAGSRRVHGHTYHCEVHVAGERNPSTGMVMDLGVLRAAIEDVRVQLDHHFLDEIADLGVPTLENLCHFVFRQVAPKVQNASFSARVSAVRVWRAAMGDSCTYAP